MKILVATSYRNIVGGVETYVQTLIPALLQRGHRVAALFDYYPNAALPPIDPPQAQIPVWYCEDLRRDRELWRELERWQPDVVYSHGIASLDIDRELQKRYPSVTYLHGYSGTCATGRKCHAFPAVQPCSKTFGAKCLLLHYPRRCGGLNPLLALRMYRSERDRHARLNEYSTILVASNHMRDEFQRNGVPAVRLRVLRLPVADIPPFAPTLEKKPTGKLLFLGRLTDLKGVEFLLRAIPVAEKKLAMRLSLTVAGDGGELSKLKDLARQLDVSAEFAGWVSGEQKVDLLRGSDLLMVPSVWPEPFGMIGVEAGRVGLPAAGFAVGGISDWLIPGQTGELAQADPPSVEGLADAIVRALADADHYNHLCRGAFELSKLFTLDRHLAELETILSAQAQHSGGWDGAPLSGNDVHPPLADLLH